MHSTHNLDDGYMGSGVIIKKIINKYGTEFLQKDILKFFNSSDEMFAYEKQYGKRKAVTNGIINKFIGEKLLSEFLHNNPDFYLGITTKSK